MTGPRYLVLTPGLAGADGVAHVARLVVGALRSADGSAAAPVDVVCVEDRHERGPGRPVDPRLPGATARDVDGPTEPCGPSRLDVAGAGGGKLRFVALALQAAIARPSDVLCLHLHLAPIARLVTGRRARLLVFLHGIEAWRSLSALERWALARADLLVANSEHTAARFLDANRDLSHRRVHVCHLGVALGDGWPDASGDTAAPDRDARDGFALIVGRLAARERYKGHDLLIDLWPRIADEVPGARLVVAGDGDDRARLEARARPLGDRVRFVGRVSDQRLAALHRDSAFFVMPSHGEGFGVVFLEAMRARKACIGGVGAAAEVIEDGVTGLVVDPADPESVHKAVVRLFREPGTRERMGAAGAARVAARFTDAEFRRRFHAVLGLDGR